MMPSPIPRDTSLATLQEIIREAEVYLNAQLTAGIAADQRAIAFTSVVAAAVVVWAGAGLLLSAQADPFLGWISVGTGILFILAMAFAILSAMPATFWFAGNSPAHWVGDLMNGVQLEHSLAEQADHYTAMIKENATVLQRNARHLRTAVWIAWVALALGTILVGLRFA